MATARAVASAGLRRSFRNWPAVICAAGTLAFAGLLGCTARAENADVGLRRAAARTTFSDDEIKDGFFKTAFHAELQFDRSGERIRKFDGPVRVFVDNHGTPDRHREIASIVADIRAHVDHIDLAITDDRKSANFVVTLLRKRAFLPTIRARYGRDKAGQIQRSLSPQCLSGIAKDQTGRIRRAEVILPVDDGEFAFYDCAYEELLQALGVINDDKSVPWTMFNDDVQMGYFDVYDQHLVNILYDPRVRPGMTRDEVDRLLPDVLPAVREWVAKADSPARAETRGGSGAALAVPCHDGRTDCDRKD